MVFFFKYVFWFCFLFFFFFLISHNKVLSLPFIALDEFWFGLILSYYYFFFFWEIEI